jgi:uncharacterized membrane protein YbhN (UPF0104 family)
MCKTLFILYRACEFLFLIFSIILYFSFSLFRDIDLEFKSWKEVKNTKKLKNSKEEDFREFRALLSFSPALLLFSIARLFLLFILSGKVCGE